MARILRYDPVARKTARFHDHGDGKVTFETLQDVEPVLDVAKAMRAVTDERARWGDGMAHVAFIPAVVVQDLMQKGILDDEERLKAWLNDPANSAFRSRHGRV